MSKQIEERSPGADLDVGVTEDGHDGSSSSSKHLAAAQALSQRILAEPGESTPEALAEWLDRANDASIRRRVTGLSAVAAQALGETLERQGTRTWSPHAEHALSVMFQAAGGDDRRTLPILVGCIVSRFGVSLGLASNWEESGLRRVWQVLQTLPRVQVANNPDLRSIERPSSIGIEKGAIGDYDQNVHEAAIAYDPATLIFDYQQATNPGDPLRGQNRFDAVVRHEIGHAVDQRVHGSTGYGSSADGAGWAWYEKDHQRLVQDLIDYSTVSTYVHGEMLVAVTERLLIAVRETSLLRDHDKLPGWTELDQNGQRAIGWAVYLLNKAMTTGQAWQHADQLTECNGRVFQCDGGFFSSYDKAARLRQVSNYQFRSPYEWFAEAYSAYYCPDPRGKGAVLAERDPKTKAWFDENVDKPVPGLAAGSRSKAAPNGRPGRDK